MPGRVSEIALAKAVSRADPRECSDTIRGGRPVGAAMAPGTRRPQPIMKPRHSFEPSRLQDQLLATVYRLVNAAAHPESPPDRTAESPAHRRPAPGEHRASLPGGL